MLSLIYNNIASTQLWRYCPQMKLERNFGWLLDAKDDHPSKMGSLRN
jgi:hypothetical protein